MKTKVFLAALAIATVMISSSCGKMGLGDKGTTDSVENALRDSIATIQAEKDTLAALMSDVADGMNQILDLQQVMSLGDLNSETANQKNQLRNQVMEVKRLVDERTNRLNELEKRLAQSTAYSDDMKKQIANLKTQLEKQQEIINQLTDALQAAHIQIDELTTNVNTLKSENEQTKSELDAANREVELQNSNNAALRARNTSLENEKNVCYYVVGTKNELKNQKIIETGFLRKTKVMEGDYTKSYFTKADKRSLNEIKLHNSKAQLMTKHPAGSYEILDVDGQKVLRITNPTSFWELTNFLVIKVG